MLTRRLYLQIYLTIIGSLVIVVLLAGLMWNLFGRDRQDRDLFEMMRTLVQMALPPAEAPVADQAAAIDRLGRELRVRLSLFDADRTLIAASAEPSPPPRWQHHHRGWRRAGPREWSLHLSDGRSLVVDLRPRGPRRPLLGLIALLGVIALGVAIGAYPLVRRLTRRLERLQAGVERIGAGDLSTRVEVRGRDEIARLATSFNEAAGKIEALLDAHRMLLAHASHELRTPLARIRLGIEMLRDGDPDRRTALEQDISELDALIDEILLMSRLGAGTDIPVDAPVDLLALAAEECAHYPDCIIDGNAPDIPGDARLLRHMIRNLLQNAHVHGSAPIHVDLSSAGDTVTLAVTDHGKGIGPADRERVFQPFQRGAGRQNVPGYGLGLALVRQIAEVHGGTATIRPADERSQRNVGTTVEVTLPLTRTPPRTRPV